MKCKNCAVENRDAETVSGGLGRCPKCYSDNIKLKNGTDRVCQICGHIWNPDEKPQKSKKKGLGCLWWFFIFLVWPFALSIWFFRTDKIKLSKKKRVIILAAAWICFLGFSNLEDTDTSETTSETVASESVIENDTNHQEETVDEIINETVLQEESNEDVVQDEQENIYSQLSDDEFAKLTNLIAKSYYSFTVDEEMYEMLMGNANINDCVKKIFDYAIDNYFQIDPVYVKEFSKRHETVTKIKNYNLLQENFKIGYMRDMVKGEWIYSIEAYEIDKENVVEYDGIKYMDPEGYLQPGVVIYWIEDDAMCMIGEIKAIEYNKEYEGTCYPYALNVEFYDDPYSSGWRDGYSFLRTNKEICGKPAYYIEIIDPNRNIKKEEIDFRGEYSWLPLRSVSASALVGTDVYMGNGSAKTFMFKIVDANKESDTMYVEYPDGNIELKSYKAIVNDTSLYERVN